jgi:hypothetical protein
MIKIIILFYCHKFLMYIYLKVKHLLIIIKLNSYPMFKMEYQIEVSIV